MRLAVTTNGKCSMAVERRARARAVELGVPFLPRRRKSPLEPLFAQADAILVFGDGGATLWDREDSLKWSPNLAHLRIKRIDDGVLDEDRFSVMSGLREGESVLDCTLGLGQDALVAARLVGPKGRVVGLESSLPLYAIVSEGLGAHDPGARSCRVEVVRANAAEHLASSPSGSFDVVCFDPMFGKPKSSTGAFEFLRRYADYAPLTEAMLHEAQRVARRLVLVKGARYSEDLRKLGLTSEPPPRSTSVLYARLPGRSGVG